MIYCLDQVSIKLQPKFKNHYISMLINYLRVYKNKKGEISREVYTGVIARLLDMLVFFLNSIDLEEIDSLDELIGEIAPHIFDEATNIRSNAHKIFMLLISNHKDQKTGSYYKQMIVSLENQGSELGHKNFVIWDDEVTLRDYVSILVKGLVYGNNENITENI